MVHSLYVHIPFCIRKCVYCDFYSIPLRPGADEEYVAALRREMPLKKRFAGEIGTVFLGGGTPSLLSDRLVCSIMDAVRENFSISRDSEVTIEANPGTITEEKAASFLSAGINRISIGIQSLNNAELELLGRVHDAAAAVSAVKDVRSAGFRNISIDLIYGIPGQDMGSWELTLEEVLKLSPEHISTYELTPEKDTLLFEKLDSGSLELPDEDLVADMYYRGIDMLHDRGYHHYEISNFAKPGCECRHNLNYWDRGEYLGLGAGAHSYYEGLRIENVKDTAKYVKDVSRGEIPVVEETVLSDDDVFKEKIFLGLRKTGGLNISGLDGEEMRKAVAKLQEQGLVEFNGNIVRLSRKGLVLCNEVILKLMDVGRY